MVIEYKYKRANNKVNAMGEEVELKTHATRWWCFEAWRVPFGIQVHVGDDIHKFSSGTFPREASWKPMNVTKHENEII